MKTRNNQTENRNNRGAQVWLRAAAVLVSVVLLSFTVSAQGLWKELLSYNSFGQMARLMVEAAPVSAEIPAPAPAAVFSIQEETDAPLDVQEWMSSDNYFGNFEAIDDVDSERPLDIEPWMTDWNYFTNRFAVENEAALPIEGWMCDSHFFNR